MTPTLSGLYNQTIISKVLPGEYIQLGQQGSLRMGQVDFSKTKTLHSNDEVLKSASFRWATPSNRLCLPSGCTLADLQSSRHRPACWLLKSQCQVWLLSVRPVNNWQCG